MNSLYYVTVRVDRLNVAEYYVVSQQDISGVAAFAQNAIDSAENMSGAVEKVELLGRAFIDPWEPTGA